jgi:hypothetical protein
MIDAKQIPDGVVEAFDRVFLEERKSGWTLDTTYRHALAAALNAWPNAIPTTATDHLLVARHALVLPLPKDAPDE